MVGECFLWFVEFKIDHADVEGAIRTREGPGVAGQDVFAQPEEVGVDLSGVGDVSSQCGGCAKPKGEAEAFR